MSRQFKSITKKSQSKGIGGDFDKLFKMISSLNEKMDIINDNVLDLQEEVEKINKKNERSNYEMNDKMSDIMSNIDNINKDFDIIKNGKIFINNNNYKELNERTYKDIMEELGVEYLLKKLSLRSERSILTVMERYFKSDTSDENYKVNFPVKCKGKVDFEYFTDGKWIDDRYGSNVVDLIFKNFQNMFLKINLYPNNVNLNAMIENQQFINKMNSATFKKAFKKKLRDELLKFS